MSAVKHKEQRVGVFIDVQNLYHSAKHIHDSRVNFKEVLKSATDGRKLVRVIAYVIKTEAGEERSFFEALTKLGIEMRVKDLQIFPGGMKKGDWDVGMAVDAIRLSSQLDAVVLVTGDGDFVPLAEYLKFNRGLQVEVMAFERTASSKLIEAVDIFINLGRGNQYLLGKNNKPGRQAM